VTELVTGIDLVEWQLRVAEGERLGRTQESIEINGHAIEARLYAEDPANDFLPATGKIALFAPPSGDGVRVDAGVATGDDVSPFYDPMIAKIIGHGATRDEARRRLISALNDTALFGVKTNRAFLIDTLQNEIFAQGEATTAFLQSWRGEARTPDTRVVTLAMLALFTRRHDIAAAQALAPAGEMKGWSSASKITTPFRFAAGDGVIHATLTPMNGGYEAVIDNETADIESVAINGDRIDVKLSGVRCRAIYHIPDDAVATVHLNVDGDDWTLTNLNAVFSEAAQSASAGAITAPMHGLLVDISVNAGERVTAGQRLATLEAMKMQHELVAEIDGTVSAVHAAAGEQVAANAVLIEIDPLTDEDKA
jgi:geranyl-CoA carboxylase alpha subunit